MLKQHCYIHLRRSLFSLPEWAVACQDVRQSRKSSRRVSGSRWRRAHRDAQLLLLWLLLMLSCCLTTSWGRSRGQTSALACKDSVAPGPREAGEGGKIGARIGACEGRTSKDRRPPRCRMCGLRQGREEGQHQRKRARACRSI